jgi:hypothetical protein
MQDMHTFEGVALGEVGIVRLGEDACFVTSDDALQESSRDLSEYFNIISNTR